MLSCSCDDFGDGDWWYERSDKHYEPMPHRKRRARCYSCRKLLNTGETVKRFNKFRHPNNEVEYEIHGDEVPMSPFFFCEECGEIYDNLTAAGLCVGLEDSMRDNLREYWEMTGFNPDKYKEVT